MEGGGDVGRAGEKEAGTWRGAQIRHVFWLRDAGN